MAGVACSAGRSCRALLTGVAMLAALSGCSLLRTPFASDAQGIDEDSPQRPARIRLSPPQVFTREQLINDRLHEDTFLRTQLDASATAALGNSLARDLQTISSLSAQASVSLDPALKLNFERQNQQAQLQQSIDLVQLRAQLLDLREQLKTASGAATITAAASAASAPSTTVTSQVSTALSDKRIGDIQSRLDSALTALATLGDSARTNGASTTFFDDFEDRVNGRQKIRSRINANSLDDSHDLEGNALYHLQFNATILPGAHKSQFGVARVTVEPPTLTAAEINVLYYTWLAEVTNRLNLDFEQNDDEKLPMSYQTLGPASRLYDVAQLLPDVKPSSVGADGMETVRDSENVRFAVPVGIGEAFGQELDLRPALEALVASGRLSGTGTCFKNAADTDLDNAVNVAVEATCKDDINRDRQQRCMTAVAKLRGHASSREMLETTIKHLLTMDRSVEMGAYALGDRSGVSGRSKDTAIRELKSFEKALANARLLLNQDDSCSTPGIERFVEQHPPQLTEATLEPIRSHIKIESLRAALSADAKTALTSSTTAEDWPGISAQLSPGEREAVERYGGMPAAREALAKEPESPTLDSSLTRFAYQILSGMGTGCPTAGTASPCVFAFPYSTDPSSLVQRVSTVASAANALDLAIAASANVPGSGASFGAGAAYARRAAGRVDAIERVPEIIGFSGASAGAPDADINRYEFGWLFGPKMSLDAEGNKVLLRQEARTVPVSVDLSLPAWWPRAKLNVTVVWKDSFEGAGDVLTKQRSVTDSLFHMKTEDAYDLPVHFRLNPASLNALTVELSHATTSQGYHQARIDRVRPQALSLCGDATTAGKLVTMMIYGVDLWRNPQVVVGGQAIPSSSVSVLPDMSGISATIDTSALSRSLIDADPTLIVSTGHGVAETSLHIRSAATCEAAAGDPTVLSAVSRKAAILRVSPAQISACDSKAVISVSGLKLASETSAFHLGAVPASSSQLLPEKDKRIETTTLVFDGLQSANKGLTSLALTMASDEGVVSVPIDVGGQSCTGSGAGGAADKAAPAFVFSPDMKIVAPSNKLTGDFYVQVSLPVGKAPAVQVSAAQGLILTAKWADPAQAKAQGATLSRKGSSWVVSTKQALVKQGEPLSIHLWFANLFSGTTLTLTATASATGVDKIPPQTAQVALVPPLPPATAAATAPPASFAMSTSLHAVAATQPDQTTQTVRIAVGLPVGKPTSVSVSSDGGSIDHVTFSDNPAPADFTLAQTGDSFKLATTDPVTAATKPVNLDVTLKNLVAGQTLLLKGGGAQPIAGKSPPQLALPIVGGVETGVAITTTTKPSP